MVPLVLFLASCQKNEKQEELFKKASERVEYRNSNCFSNSIEDICPNQAIKKDTIELDSIPGYPTGCSFEVEYDFVDCQLFGIPNVYSYVIGDFKIISIDCQQYENDIDSIMMNLGIGSLTLADYMTNLYKKLVEAASEKVFVTYFKHLYDCKNVASNMWTLSWIKSSCERYCFVRFPGQSHFTGLPVECGTGCCITYIDLCWDSDENKVIKTITSVEANQGECDSPSSIPPAFCSLSSACSFTCE